MFNLSNTFTKYIFICLFIIVGVGISGMCLNYQNYVIEGLANHNRNIVEKGFYAQLEQELRDFNEEKSDSLLPKKYKKEYENVLIELYKNTQLEMLQNISEYGNSLLQDKSSSNSNKHLDNIIKLHTLNNSLNSSMKFINSV